MTTDPAAAGPGRSPTAGSLGPIGRGDRPAPLPGVSIPEIHNRAALADLVRPGVPVEANVLAFVVRNGYETGV